MTYAASLLEGVLPFTGGQCHLLDIFSISVLEYVVNVGEVEVFSEDS